MSALITVLCWGVLIVWVGRHEFGIARDALQRRQDRRQSASALDDCFARMRLYPTRGRTVQAAPIQQSQAHAAQTAGPVTGGVNSDDAEV